MKTKQLAPKQALWGEILHCFNLKIKFQQERQPIKPDALSQQPDPAPKKEDKLPFGQLLKPTNTTLATFTEILVFDTFFHDDTVKLDNSKN